MQTNIVADLFKGPRVQERGDAVHPRFQPRARHARGHRNHVLFRNARVDEPGLTGVAHALKCHESQVPG